MYMYRISAEVTQFKEGINQVFGLWDIMASHPEVCLPLLSRAPEPLTRTTLRDLFEPVYSVAGSNNRAQEEETVYAWEAFLQDIEGVLCCP
ncbi:hypothetical protein DPMN_027887 [Dreissena polymorpha]|uniref:Uncharacterized protein n=1 Tax=Dreissena polymorpha TaxID=45954 RepID=A0A9D4RDV4_DREPO|nr:hypothetical protein DPMN_027887 [Dreissena polymorpha]